MSKIRTKARTAMFHVNRQVRFNAGYCRQDMIQDLLGGHPERSAASVDLKPTGLVPVIALSELLGPDVCSHRLDQASDFFFSSGSLGRAKNASSSHSPFILPQTLRYEPSKLMCSLSGWSKLSVKLPNSSAISPD